MSNGFVLLWGKILQSSIWDEDTATRVVWITMLAMKDEGGLVISTFDSLRRSANVTAEECQRALDKFLAPDPASGSKADEGRRIKKAAGGWTIINHEKYRYSSEERRNYWRQKKAEQREKARRPKKRKQFIGAPLTAEEKHAEKNDSEILQIDYERQ